MHSRQRSHPPYSAKGKTVSSNNRVKWLKIYPQLQPLTFSMLLKFNHFIQSVAWNQHLPNFWWFFFTFMWPCIVTNFFIKPTRCTNFTNLFWREITCFGQFLCPSSGVYSQYTQQWYMPCRFVDSFRAGPGWPCSKVVCKPVEFHAKINMWN